MTTRSALFVGFVLIAWMSYDLFFTPESGSEAKPDYLDINGMEVELIGEQTESTRYLASIDVWFNKYSNVAETKEQYKEFTTGQKLYRSPHSGVCYLAETSLSRLKQFKAGILAPELKRRFGPIDCDDGKNKLAAQDDTKEVSTPSASPVN